MMSYCPPPYRHRLTKHRHYRVTHSKHVFENKIVFNIHFERGRLPGLHEIQKTNIKESFLDYCACQVYCVHLNVLSFGQALASSLACEALLLQALNLVQQLLSVNSGASLLRIGLRSKIKKAILAQGDMVPHELQ